MTKSLIYLASPYSHKDPEVMKCRFKAICKTAALLHQSGINVLCPIASSHVIAKYGKLTDHLWDYWKELDLNYIDRCDEVWVTMLDKEWQTSVGMRAEVEYAMKDNKPIRLITKLGKRLVARPIDILGWLQNPNNNYYEE